MSSTSGTARARGAEKLGEIGAHQAGVRDRPPAGRPHAGRHRRPVALGDLRLPQRREAEARAQGARRPEPGRRLLQRLVDRRRSRVALRRSTTWCAPTGPQITSYGTWRGDGEHGQGRAIDIMVSGETGWAVANFLRANYSALGIEYIIYSQNIWSVERSGEGWRGMSDRGSTTANHYDHVHVTVY